MSDEIDDEVVQAIADTALDILKYAIFKDREKVKSTLLGIEATYGHQGILATMLVWIDAASMRLYDEPPVPVSEGGVVQPVLMRDGEVVDIDDCPEHMQVGMRLVAARMSMDQHLYHALLMTMSKDNRTWNAGVSAVLDICSSAFRGTTVGYVNRGGRDIPQQGGRG